MDRYYTKLFNKILAAFMDKAIRYIILPGGTSSSKTFSTLQLLREVALKSKSKRLVSVCSETFPHLQRGAMRDFENILGDEYSEGSHNKTNHVYTINKSPLEFFSVDIPGRARGPRRKILYCNEVNNMQKEVFEDLEIRTDEKVIADYNPTNEFWITEYLDLKETVVIKSNYKDNTRLPESIKSRIEQKAERDPNFKRVHIDVEWGSNEGLIFPSWTQIDSYPEQVKSERFGMDFGFTHPTTLIRCGVIEDCLYLDEMIYKTGMITADILKELEATGISKSAMIFADNARPEQITEIHQDGWFIQPAEKPKDSIITGINKIKQYKIYITKRSVNLIKEFRNYCWMKDKISSQFKKDVPVDAFNHGCDAVRYAVWDMSQPDILIRSL